MIIAKTEKGLNYFKDLFNKKTELVDKILPELSLQNPDFSKLEDIEESI
jgi:hypothetical protein